jgi:hypothetical protein
VRRFVHFLAQRGITQATAPLCCSLR